MIVVVIYHISLYHRNNILCIHHLGDEHPKKLFVSAGLATLDANGSHAAHVLQESIDGQLTSHEGGGFPQVEVAF